MSHTCPACQHTFDADAIAGVLCCPRCAKNFQADQDQTVAQSAAVSDKWTAATGQSFGRFQLEKKIGQGGMAEVWLATDHGKQVVIKILLASVAENEHIRKRFEREIESLERFDHPNIIPIIDHGEANDRLYYVTEIYAKSSLRQEIDRRSREPVDLDFIQTVAEHCLAALDHAHQQNIIHRDIKPENILLLHDGTFAISDFGIAQVHSTHDGQTLTMLTNTNVVLGTYAYMAPEQSRGSRAVDARADLYALGVVLYECISGHLPEGRFEDPAHFLSHWPEAEQEKWNAFILRLLERDPAKRFASAATASAIVLDRSSAPKQQKTFVVNHDPAYPHGGTLYRHPSHSWLGGVCSGFGAWTGIDAGWLRLAMCIGTLFTGGILFIAYIAAVLLIPNCPDPLYHPRPLNRNLPQRGDGWVLGVCEMLGQRSGNSGIWRIIFVILCPFTGFLILLPYLAIGIIFPPPRMVQHPTKRHLRKKHQTAAKRTSAEQADADPMPNIGWSPSFLSALPAAAALGYLGYEFIAFQDNLGLGVLLLAIALFFSSRLHTRIEAAPSSFTGLGSGLVLAGCILFMTHVFFDTSISKQTVGVSPLPIVAQAHSKPAMPIMVNGKLIDGNKPIITTNTNAWNAAVPASQNTSPRWHIHYFENMQFAAPICIAAGLLWSLLIGYYGPLAIFLGMITPLMVVNALNTNALLFDGIFENTVFSCAILGFLWLISAKIYKHLLRWIVNAPEGASRHYDIGATIIGISAIGSIIYVTGFFYV